MGSNVNPDLVEFSDLACAILDSLYVESNGGEFEPITDVYDHIAQVLVFESRLRLRGFMVVPIGADNRAPSEGGNAEAIGRSLPDNGHAIAPPEADQNGSSTPTPDGEA